jgi:hypothetical protein
MREHASASLKLSIANARQMRAFVQSQLNQIASRDDRGHTALGFMSVALQHEDSIIRLVEIGDHDSSALALVRCLIEACHRGMWLLTCATDDQVEHIRSQEFDWGIFREMGDEIAKKLKLSVDFAIPKDAWGLLNSFTHTGYEQLARQYDPEGFIEAAFDPDYLEAFVPLTSVNLALLAAGTCVQCGRGDFSRQIVEVYHKLFPSREG